MRTRAWGQNVFLFVVVDRHLSFNRRRKRVHSIRKQNKFSFFFLDRVVVISHKNFLQFLG